MPSYQSRRKDVRILDPKLSEKIYILIHGGERGCEDPPSQTINGNIGDRGCEDLTSQTIKENISYILVDVRILHPKLSKKI